MDQNLTPEEKKKIYEDLFDITFEELKSKKLTVEDGQILAGFVLYHLLLNSIHITSSIGLYSRPPMKKSLCGNYLWLTQ